MKFFLTLLFAVIYTECTFSAQLDGNGDGILDNEQPYVITIPDVITGEYLTLVTDNCPIQVASSHADIENTEYNFPQGIFYYELQCTKANITIYFHAINQLKNNLVYQKYGPTTPGDLSTSAWYTLPNVTFTKTTIYGQSVVTASFTLIDGELGDDTGVDGKIVDPGGIAYNDDIGNVISFISKKFTVSRQAGQAVITVNRNGLIGNFAVDYSIVGNTAIVEKDFQTVSGTLVWTDNERGDKTFTIPITQTATVGNIIQLNLANLNPLLEDSLLGIEKATLTITDDDILTTLTPQLVQDLPSIIDTAYIGQDQTFTENVTVTNIGNISHSIFAGYVENNGMIANSTFLETATVSGGKLSGNIINKGIIENINFVGNSLNGGILSGNITNESEIGGVIKDVYLAAGTILKGGKVGGEINGDPTDPPVITAAEILSGTILSNVTLSLTVKLPDDVILGEGVIIPTEPYQPEDFGINAEDIASMDSVEFSELELEALATFSAEDVASIPPETLSELKPEQIAVMEKLNNLTKEQFAAIPVEALEGLTAENMGDFSVEIIDKFTPEHVKALNPKIFKNMSSKLISRLLVNFDSNKITPKQVADLLPKGWELDMATGALTPPIGAKLTPQYLHSSIPNINTGIGLGGQGTSIKEGLTSSLINEDLTDFVISQQEDGILIVEGTGKSAGIEYSFIPDADNIIQVNTEKTPIGLSVDNGGFFRVTTPEGQQYKVVPTPHDPLGIEEVLNNQAIAIGKNGDVLMQIPKNTRMMNYNHYVAIFDPFIEPSPGNWCIEIENGESLCDFAQAPTAERPGLHFPKERANLEFKEARMVYPDGTTQTCTPTVYSPETFIAEALKYPGVEKISFNSNGSFYVLHEGKSYILKPSFTTAETTASTPTIALNDKGGVNYSVPVELPSNTRRNAKVMLMFDLFIEPAPDNWCIEVGDGDVFCDFNNVPAN